MLPTKHELGGAVAICPRHIAPFIQSLRGVGPCFITLAENVFDGFHCSLGKAVALGVVWGSEFLGNVVFCLEFREIAAELRANRAC